MMDALRSTVHHKYTENDAPAFSSTLSPTLDAYMGLRKGISGTSVDWYLEEAWAQDPTLTLRLIWRCRSIHDGQGDRELFYRAFGWLYEHHPRTAITNLRYLVEPLCFRSGKNKTLRSGLSHGYWKDLLNILALATVDELSVTPLDPLSTFLHNYVQAGSRPFFKDKEEQNRWSRKQREERFAKAHSRLLGKLAENRYRALYISISQLFAEQLSRDSRVLDQLDFLPTESEECKKPEFNLSLAPKWAPTPGGAHDRITNICSAICMLLHYRQVTPLVRKLPTSSPGNYSALEWHILRCAYQKYILSRARSITQLPEPLMSANRWSEIPYSCVASLCMQANKARFFTRDRERFVKYLSDVESGNRSISGATLLPHMLVMQAVQYTRELATLGLLDSALAATQLHVVEAQWAMLLSRLCKTGTLDNCIAVCDVSGLMGLVHYVRHVGWRFSVDPIWPVLSLSLIIARLAKPPFQDAFITFSLILPLAVKHKVPRDEMIKRVFVFSDMQFNDLHDNSSRDWKTNHDVIEQAYRGAGYDVPEIIYWDLSSTGHYPGITVPVTVEREGIAMLSGYSPSLLQTFMDVDEDWEVVDREGDKVKQAFTPEGMMNKDLQKKSFEPLVVVD
ncbi:hypothetical protein M404DRAFT_13666 [Pisolithus tinctorius Marx 270]|uniref:Uncharacterized protein n=1 Tax=Pisolithus tinctorius Marx 270 TaxID=870435 RepID=A0A0C3PN87_PISTI|nr:hypothetical protein M404DRAFT_13666 [Pisolithus tinctorius Marx 270]